MSDIYLNPLNEEVMQFTPLLPFTMVNFINSSGKKQNLYFYTKQEAFDFTEERKLIRQNKLYVFSKDTIKKLEIIEEEPYKRVVLNDKFFFKLDKKNFSKMSDFFFKINMGLKNGYSWGRVSEESEITSKISSEIKKEKKKGKIEKMGCLSIIFIISFLIYAFVSYEPSPLEKIFEENDLGIVENVTEEPWNTNGKNIVFETRKIKYRAYLEEDGTPYQIFVGKGKAFPIYDVSNNDTIIDENEKLIIERMTDFIERSSKTFSGLIPEIKDDLKSQLNFPDTFSCEDIVYFDMGKYYILNVTFTAKNAFGMKMRNVAKYKMNFETNSYTLIEIL